jgi:hypothetical protein
MALRLRNGMSANGALSCPTFYFCTKRTYQRAEHYVFRAVRLEYEDSCYRVLCVAGNMPFTAIRGEDRSAPDTRLRLLAGGPGAYCFSGLLNLCVSPTAD